MPAGPAQRATLASTDGFGIYAGTKYPEAAWELVKDWTLEERQAIHEQTPRLGLRTPIPGGKTLKDLGLTVLELARAALHRHGCNNGEGCDESIYLDPLFTTVESGTSPAKRLLDAFHGPWQGDIDRVFQEREIDSFIAKCS
jgi:glutamate--cysteine ligase